MRRIKILFLFLGGAVVLCIVLFVVLLFTLEDDHYRWLVTRTAERLTGYKVVIEGPFSLDLSMQPSLSASKIRLEPGPGGLQPPVTHIGQLKIKFAVRPLQSGTIFIRDLFVDDVTISVITGGDLQTDERYESATESPPEMVIPIIESVTLQNIDVNITNKDIGRTTQIRLRRLNIDDIGDTGPMYVKADGAVNAFDFRINGKLGSLADILDPARPYPIELNLNMADLGLTVSGTVDDPVHGKGIALSFSGSSTNRNIIRIFLPDDLPDFSELKLEGNLCEVQGDYALENVNVYAADDHGLAIKADGGLRLGEPVNAPRVKEMDMRFQLSSPTTEALKPFLGDWLREMGPVSVSGRVLGSGDKYQYDELDARASDAQGLVVEVSGSVGIVKEATGEPPDEIDLEVCITAPNMGAAEPLLGARYLSDLGPVRAKGHITGTTEVLSLENIVVKAGESSSVNVEWRGRVGNIPLSSDQFVSDVEIFGSIQAKDASALASLAQISVPHLGPLAGSWRVVDHEDSLGLDDVEILLGEAKTFQLKATGRIDSVVRRNKVSMDGIDFELAATAPKAAAIPVLANLDLPDLGPLWLKAHLNDDDNSLDVEKFEIRTGPDQKATLLAKGKISHLQDLSQTTLHATFEAATQPWIEKFIQSSVPGSHHMSGKVRLANATDHFRIQELQIATTDPEGLSLRANGTVKEVAGLYEVDAQIASEATNTSLIGSILGTSLPPLGPLAIKGRLKGNRNEATFEGETHLAHSQFRTSVECSFDTRLPRIVANISTPAINLADLGIYPDLSPRDSAQETSPESSPSYKLLFDETPLPLDMLKAVDLSISLDAEKVMGKNFVLQNLDLDLLLQDARFHISSAKLKHAEGYVTIDFMIDSAGSKPQISLKATAEDVDMEAVLAHVHRPLVVGGQLNLVVDLHSAGRSAREIASALTGEFGFAIENGRIKRGVELLGADAVSLLSTLPRVKKYQDLNCLAIRLIFEDGIGNSQIILIDTPKTRAWGVGSVNLISETMDLVIQPKPKKDLPGLSSAVRIQGPLADPQVRKLPLREAARLYGEIFMPYVFLPARGLGYLWYLIKNDKDEQSPCLLTVPEN